MMQMTKGYFGDLLTWVLDDDIQDKVFRVWFDKENMDETCSYMYFTQIIELGNGDFLIGLQEYDETKPGRRYPYITYRRLGEFNFAYCESDQDEDD